MPAKKKATKKKVAAKKASPAKKKAIGRKAEYETKPAIIRRKDPRTKNWSYYMGARGWSEDKDDAAIYGTDFKAAQVAVRLNIENIVLINA